MTAFAYELATLLQTQAQARPGDPEGAYSMPWYLVLGEPGSGKSSAIRAMNLSWPYGDGPIPLTQPQPLCSYWLSQHAAYIEPGPSVVGPARQPQQLQELMHEVKDKRPREPIDGIIVVVNLHTVMEASEDDVGRYAKALRRYLVEASQAMATDVPTYIVVTAYDTLWGFGDAFKWSAARRDEDPWGFWLNPNLEPEQVPDQVQKELDGLLARVESMCFDKLSQEDAPDQRARAFQHLLEVRWAFDRLGEVMKVLAMGNAYEIAPWIRALALGSSTPGTGQKLHYFINDLIQMGMVPPAQSGTPNPGGMPLHAYMEYVLLPERDIVPTQVRWRDDKLLLGIWIGAIVLWVITIIAIAVKALV